MIDGVGKGGAGRIDIARQDQGAGIGTPRSHGPRADGAVKSEVLELVSRRAPVDVSRVEAVRAALQSGTYRVDPNRIAQRMLDFDFPRRS